MLTVEFGLVIISEHIVQSLSKPCCFSIVIGATSKPYVTQISRSDYNQSRGVHSTVKLNTTCNKIKNCTFYIKHHHNGSKL